MNQKERSRKHYINNREAYLERAKRQRKYEKAKLSPQRLIWQRIKASAKARGLEFDLRVEDIVLPEICPYTGLLLKFNEGRPGRDSYTVDRIDNSKGYIKGNIEVVSYQANAMKQDASIELLLKFAKEVIRRYEISEL